MRAWSILSSMVARLTAVGKSSRKYADKLSGWVSEKDRGQADAINKGLKRAGGEIVAWLNSDDYYLPGAVSRAVKTFQQHPEAGLVYGNVLSVDGEGKTFNLQAFRALYTAQT